MLNDERRTVEESYTSATNSSNLRCEADRRTDVDVLTAAGWSQSRIGQALLRLASEYDGASRAGHGTPMDTAMFVGKLRTLPEVRVQLAMQLAVWAVDNAHDEELKIIAWWLHKVCGKCHGRGYDVVPGTGRLSGNACRSCDGSGQARIPCGESGKRMANFMDDCVQRARQSIKKRLLPETGLSARHSG